MIDLRTIVPWDQDIVAESVAPTHRLLVVHEDMLTAGFGGRGRGVGRRALLRRPRRTRARGSAALDTHVAYEPSLEQAILPQVDDIVGAIADVCSY